MSKEPEPATLKGKLKTRIETLKFISEEEIERRAKNPP
jgi:hypothetical protein